MLDFRYGMEDIKAKVQQHTSGLLDARLYAQSAVLLPLLKEDNGILSLLFEVRSCNLKTQPGEICFPGGRLQPGDRSVKEAALRETCEELGLDPDSVEIWGGLDILVTPFRQVIYPFVGLLREPQNIRPNPLEVEEVFTAPLDRLLSLTPEYHEITLQVQPPEDFPFDKIPHGRQYPWRRASWPELFYEFEERIIWGLTARLLQHFLAIIKSDMYGFI
ncbi:NUDIX hydrolase [Moorella stamsii]|uniref:NUDIX hydrolase n=1 Tax=Neomoorella stamsii TaxID=1266720 RepID=UPI001AD91B30|nr:MULTISPECIES: CoA pyrophosphatase [Moorella]